MAVFSVVSSCPDCGAPIWADLTDQDGHNPPQSRFSCECKIEKRNLCSQEPISGDFNPYVARFYLNDDSTGTPSFQNLNIGIVNRLSPSLPDPRSNS